VHAQSCIQTEKAFTERGHHKNKTSAHRQREAERDWSNLATPPKTVGPTVHPNNMSATGEAAYSFRSPESVEMDEIMAAMVLTSLSCSPVVQSLPQTDPGPAGSSSSADMECGGGELSDSGSSGYWSWDHGNVSPTPSPSVTEVDSSLDEGLHMEIEQGEELSAKKPKSSFRGVYKCLWPSCGKVLTSSVGIKRHIRVLHLGSGSDQSQREEDFYYTKISCESMDASTTTTPSQQALGQASSSHLSWASCGSPSGSELQIPPAHRPRSNSSSGLGPSRPSPLSQSAPSSFWQIHSEHLYQMVKPLPGLSCWGNSGLTEQAPASERPPPALTAPSDRSRISERPRFSEEQSSDIPRPSPSPLRNKTHLPFLLALGSPAFGEQARVSVHPFPDASHIDPARQPVRTLVTRAECRRSSACHQRHMKHRRTHRVNAAHLSNIVATTVGLMPE
ncbi:zinc finger protein 395-like isoform X1, partial [Lates japonicus]